MATWFAMECDHGDAWSVFSETDQEPTGDALLCPDGGHPAVVLARRPLDRFVRITLAGASAPPTSQADTRSLFFVELATWDGTDRLRSQKTYSWGEAVKRAELFHNLSWEDAERRWRRLGV
jgi:hypothetical protein